MQNNIEGGMNMPVNSFENYPMTWKPKIEKNNENPIYLEIAQALENDIRKGILQPNDKLPPQRELADFLDVNLSTIARAFKICTSKGLLSGVIGRGTYIAADVMANMPMLDEAGLESCINMGASHPLYEQNHYVVQSMKRLIKKANIENILKYTETSGRLSHKKSAQKWIEYFGLKTELENIVITSGLQNSLAILLSSLFHYGDKIATNELIYPGIKNVANMLGIQLMPVPYDDEKIDIQALEQLCKLENIKGIFVIPDYHNPTTITMSFEERKSLAALAEKYDLLCLEDGTYSFLTERKILPITSLIPERSIYISTISNSICAGLRIAFVVAPTKVIMRITNAINNINVMSSPFEAELVSQMIENELAIKIVDEKIKEIQERNKITNKVLGGYTVWGDLNSQFRWLMLPTFWTGTQFEKKLKQKGVQVFCCERFVVGSNSIAPAVRIAICTPSTIRDLEKGLYIIKETLEDN